MDVRLWKVDGWQIVEGGWMAARCADGGGDVVISMRGGH